MKDPHQLKLWVCIAAVSTGWAHAQIDPTPRRMIQLGYNQPLEGQAPFAGYAFYYHNQPGFVRTNWTLRAAVAPVYADMEMGLNGLLGPQTDMGVGIAGGGFADSHSEVRRGRWIKSESFMGHAGEFSLGVYHLLNPLEEGQVPSRLSEAPAQIVLRGALRYSLYERNDNTAPNFDIPGDRPTGHVRIGIRWGGREPLMEPPVAFELSAWYEGQFRADADDYGYGGTTPAEPQSHLFWARGLVAYTLPSNHRFEVSATLGTSANADRLSTYRLGGTLPLAAEFPLMIPGYYFEELSVRSFALVNASYSVPLGKQWEFLGFGGAAVSDSLPGLETAEDLNAGVGAGLGWESTEGGWRLVVGYAYGINAPRNDEMGAHNVGLLVQYDLDRGKLPPIPEKERIRSIIGRLNPTGWRGFNGLFRR